MTKYLLNRLLRGLLSVVIVVIVVMLLVYSFIDRDVVFSKRKNKKSFNALTIYKYSCWEEFGYLDYVPYSEYMGALLKNGEISKEDHKKAVIIGQTAKKDSALTEKYVAKFTDYYEDQGYTIVRLNAVKDADGKLASGGAPELFAYKDLPLGSRVLSFFKNLITIDNVHYVEDEYGNTVEDRGLTFTFFDPLYNTNKNGEAVKEKFSPAIIGNGTRHKYLLYFDSNFPFIHQNLVSIKLGTSISVEQDVEVFDSLTMSQGQGVKSTVTYLTGFSEQTEDNLHSATYGGSRISNTFNDARYTDDYTNMTTFKENKSRLGFSFVIGLIASAIAYLLAVPLGITMARNKDKLIDKLGTIYIIFILAVPSLAYIYMFRAIGMKAGLPSDFTLTNENWLMYVLPIISLALPSIAGLMKWLRRYMIDQMNSDYVKFARSGGLSEGEIFRKHIFKNAVIPIVHGIPASILGSLVGAIITERIYLVPGAGNMLTNAITHYDNSVIIGLTLFYSLISIISIILGDILMAMIDPRISFNSKAR